MVALHAWQCPCGARNAPQLLQCHHCRGYQAAGSPIYLDATAAPPLSFNQSAGLAIGTAVRTVWFGLKGAVGAVLALALIVFMLCTFQFWLALAIIVVPLALLYWIGAGVWKIVERDRGPK